jgi:hypothetical protein
MPLLRSSYHSTNEFWIPQIWCYCLSFCCVLKRFNTQIRHSNENSRAHIFRGLMLCASRLTNLRSGYLDISLGAVGAFASSQCQPTSFVSVCLDNFIMEGACHRTNAAGGIVCRVAHSYPPCCNSSRVDVTGRVRQIQWLNWAEDVTFACPAYSTVPAYCASQGYLTSTIQRDQYAWLHVHAIKQVSKSLRSDHFYFLTRLRK